MKFQNSNVAAKITWQTQVRLNVNRTPSDSKCKVAADDLIHIESILVHSWIGSFDLSRANRRNSRQRNAMKVRTRYCRHKVFFALENLSANSDKFPRDHRVLFYQKHKSPLFLGGCQTTIQNRRCCTNASF